MKINVEPPLEKVQMGEHVLLRTLPVAAKVGHVTLSANQNRWDLADYDIVFVNYSPSDTSTYTIRGIGKPGSTTPTDGQTVIIQFIPDESASGHVIFDEGTSPSDNAFQIFSIDFGVAVSKALGGRVVATYSSTIKTTNFTGGAWIISTEISIDNRPFDTDNHNHNGDMLVWFDGYTAAGRGPVRVASVLKEIKVAAGYGWWFLPKGEDGSLQAPSGSQSEWQAGAFAMAIYDTADQTSPAVIHGMSGTGGGGTGKFQRIAFHVRAGKSVTLKHLSSLSTFAQIRSVTGADIVLPEGFHIVEFLYESNPFADPVEPVWAATPKFPTAVILQDGAVTTDKIADSAVTTPKLADAAVTTAKLGDAQVTNAKIVDGTISNDKLDGTGFLDGVI